MSTQQHQKDLKNYNYKPGSVLEKKAKFLEETLENMQNYSDFLYQKIKRLERQGKKPRALRRKLKSVNNGIAEVFDKADILWKDIASNEKG